MSVSPQAPQPPVPPQPPRTGSHLLAIALLALGLIICVSVMTIWVGLRIISRGVSVNVDERGSGAKQVSIKTPVGSLEVAKEVNEARLGLPIYPGATQVKDDSSATVNLAFGQEASLQVLAAKFQTSDELATVRDFYKQRLGSEVTKFVERSPEGKTVFEIKKSGQEKIVALQSQASGTRIELVRVTHGPRESN